MITAEKLTKRFRSITALNGVTVKIPKGTNLIVGPNGGGKSTFLKIAAGVYRPTSGDIKVFGKNPWSDGAVRKRIGVAFDPPRFPTFVTGREWLSIFARARGKDDVEEVAEILGIDYLDRRIVSYSSGMLKRLSLAQALVGNPYLVMLDEPLANLDFSGIRDIIGTIKELREEKSFLIISHMWEPLLPVVDRVYVIADGRLVAQGDAGEIEETLRRLY
ncbi:ABC-type multidrug transport system, ATPase component [Thermococcus onnurineus NA1]|uniref:ABC-type multidrug transport system, ATPase component n=1 Tax=Thermococcus onnurineus (strain NA1) TaxID=523850 RepID=B6YWR2_THEON|nr:ABC transporter ATP-binding protein [Thermococcus onnurineus]ACJ16525.1 ABC-type multidrug transport system, ATPase component [Thermococcus onnurineus NA1]